MGRWGVTRLKEHSWRAVELRLPPGWTTREAAYLPQKVSVRRGSFWKLTGMEMLPGGINMTLNLAMKGQRRVHVWGQGKARRLRTCVHAEPDPGFGRKGRGTPLVGKGGRFCSEILENEFEKWGMGWSVSPADW